MKFCALILCKLFPSCFIFRKKSTMAVVHCTRGPRFSQFLASHLGFYLNMFINLVLPNIYYFISLLLTRSRASCIDTQNKPRFALLKYWICRLPRKTIRARMIDSLTTHKQGVGCGLLIYYWFLLFLWLFLSNISDTTQPNFNNWYVSLDYYLHIQTYFCFSTFVWITTTQNKV